MSDALVDEVCHRAGRIAGAVDEVVRAQVDLLAPLATDTERAAIIARSIARLDGLGALDELVRDPDVDEVIVNRGREVWIERDGRLTRLPDLADGAVDVILERVLTPLGRRLDRTSPIVDARLPGGARLCAVVPPVAVDGPTIAIRRHRARSVPIERFAAPAVADLLGVLVRRRANVLVTGATSSGKTTLLAALCRSLPEAERVVTIEDTTELDLDDRHAVRLEARPATADGPAPVDPVALVRTALRLRPDRLVVGEFRGPEVLAVVQALNTGHDGSLSTCHANGTVDGLRRVETLVMQAAPSWPLAAIRRDVSRSIDAVVHLARRGDGARRVVEVIEVVESGDEPSGRTIATGDDVTGEFGRGRA